MIKDHRVYKPNKQKNKGRVLLFIIKIIFLILTLNAIISHFIISSYRINSIAMEPTIKKGNRLLISPLNYGVFIPFSNQRINGFQKPERGEIVLIKPPFLKKVNFPFSLLNAAIRFLSFNHVQYNKSTPDFLIKRIIGIPGDTIKLENYIAYIKPVNKEQFTIESELIKKNYITNVNSNINPSEWGNEYFFSGNLNEIVLQENEYFVLGDNRTTSNDSRSWGTINYSNIISKIIFRYFPINKMGIPE